MNLNKIISTIEVLTRHHPVSVSVQDNFSEKPPICHVAANPDALLELMLMSTRESTNI